MPLENLTIRWIALSSLRTTEPRYPGEHSKNAFMPFDFYKYSHLTWSLTYAIPLCMYLFFTSRTAFIDYSKLHFDAYIKYSISDRGD